MFNKRICLQTYCVYGGEEGRVQGLVGKREGKRPRGRPMCRWEDNIKMELKEVVCEGMEWIDVAQDMDRLRALVNAAMNSRVS